MQKVRSKLKGLVVVLRTLPSTRDGRRRTQTFIALSAKSWEAETWVNIFVWIRWTTQFARSQNDIQIRTARVQARRCWTREDNFRRYCGLTSQTMGRLVYLYGHGGPRGWHSTFAVSFSISLVKYTQRRHRNLFNHVLAIKMTSHKAKYIFVSTYERPIHLSSQGIFQEMARSGAQIRWRRRCYGCEAEGNWMDPTGCRGRIV